jgi:shikimate kinase
MNIYIIGMPGSGKTTFARHLAKAPQYQYVDLDGMIEKDALMFVDQMFETLGEQVFRKLEHEALIKTQTMDHAVISCGGGIVLDKNHKTIMQGFVIYVDTELDIIKERLKTDYQRPILKQKSLETLYEERYLKYLDFADMIVSNDHDIESLVNQAIQRLKEKEII